MNKLLAIGSSYLSSLTPQSTNKLPAIRNKPTNIMWWKALIRAHWLPNWLITFVSLGALIRAVWFPNWTRNFVSSGALIRAHWIPDQPTNFLQLGALIRTQWLLDPPENILHSGTFTRGHTDSLINQDSSPRWNGKFVDYF